MNPSSTGSGTLVLPGQKEDGDVQATGFAVQEQ
jgi:hypothetical protein